MSYFLSKELIAATCWEPWVCLEPQPTSDSWRSASLSRFLLLYVNDCRLMCKSLQSHYIYPKPCGCRLSYPDVIILFEFWGCLVLLPTLDSQSLAFFIAFLLIYYFSGLDRRWLCLEPPEPWARWSARLPRSRAAGLSASRELMIR